MEHYVLDTPWAMKKFEVQKEFIQLLEKLPLLWNPQNMYYTNRYKRHEALTQLVSVLQQIKPEATVYDVRKKINTMRSNYRRELRKVLHSRLSGEEEIYKPKVWYFSLLQFLFNPDAGSATETNNDPEYNMSDEMPMCDVIIKTESSSENEAPNTTYPEQNDNVFAFSAPIYPLSPDGKPERGKKKFNSKDSVTKLEHDGPQMNPQVMLWTEKLATLTPVQRLYAEKAINTVLCAAELGNLHEDSFKLIENQGKGWFQHVQNREAH